MVLRSGAGQSTQAAKRADMVLREKLNIANILRQFRCEQLLVKDKSPMNFDNCEMSRPPPPIAFLLGCFLLTIFISHVDTAEPFLLSHSGSFECFPVCDLLINEHELHSSYESKIICRKQKRGVRAG